MIKFKIWSVIFQKQHEKKPNLKFLYVYIVVGPIGHPIGPCYKEPNKSGLLDSHWAINPRFPLNSYPARHVEPIKTQQEQCLDSSSELSLKFLAPNLSIKKTPL